MGLRKKRQFRHRRGQTAAGRPGVGRAPKPKSRTSTKPGSRKLPQRSVVRSGSLPSQGSVVRSGSLPSQKPKSKK